MTAPRLPRRDFADLQPGEAWAPPSFGSAKTTKERFVAWVRRLLDLQAASIWRDLKPLLGTVEGRVLDVGAGAQPYRGLLPAEASYRAIDVELADAFGYDQPDTTYYTGDRWPVDDESVDVVFATETLEHVPEPDVFLAEARRVVVPGGRLLLTVPFAARWHYVPHDYWRYTPSSLRNLLHAAGFEGVSVYARGNETTVACAKLMALILPFLMPQGQRRASRQVLGVLLLPLLGVLAMVGQTSLRGDGGEDCLGWTVIATAAEAPSPTPSDRQGGRTR